MTAGGDDESEWAMLMRAATAGDAAAYRRLLTAIAPALRGIVRARAGGLGPEAGEDVVQEILLAIHLKRDTWDPARPLRPWLWAIARHKLVDAFRRRGRAIHLPVEVVVETLAAPEGDDPFEAADAGRLIAALPARDAALLRCLALEARRRDECAARLGLTEGAMRVALHRALQRLADLRRNAKVG